MCFMDIKEWMLRGDKSVEILFVGFVARVFVRWLSSHNFSTEKPDAKIHLFVSRPRRERILKPLFYFMPQSFVFLFL